MKEIIIDKESSNLKKFWNTFGINKDTVYSFKLGIQYGVVGTFYYGEELTTNCGIYGATTVPFSSDSNGYTEPSQLNMDSIFSYNMDDLYIFRNPNTFSKQNYVIRILYRTSV